MPYRRVDGANRLALRLKLFFFEILDDEEFII